MDIGGILVAAISPLWTAAWVWLVYKFAELLSERAPITRRGQALTWIGALIGCPLGGWLLLNTKDNLEDAIAFYCTLLIITLVGLLNGAKKWRELRRQYMNAGHPESVDEAIGILRERGPYRPRAE